MLTREQIAAIVLNRVDWERPELRDTPFHRAWLAGDATAAALGFIRHLRQRPKPDLGFSAEYIAALQAHATPAFRHQAREYMDRVVGVGFLGGDFPDGRGTLIGSRPELIQVGGRPEHFQAFATTIAESHEGWARGIQHVAGGIARYLQTVWAMASCRDEDLLPLFGFLVTQFDAEWARVRNWNEAMLGTSGHNWWVAEFGRIWTAAFFFPEFKGFSKLHALFPAFFEREMELLIDEDGFTRERSVSYHTGTSDLFLDAARIAQRNGLALSPAFDEKLRRMYAIEWQMMTPDGNHPAFGDCFNQPGYTFARLRSIAAIVSVPEAKYLAETMDPGRPSDFGAMLIESLHYPSIGEDLRPAYDAVVPQPPPTRDIALANAGYYIMRQNWTRDADYLAIEACPKGNLVTSHGHGCFFDLRLYSRGRHILIANGKGPCGTTQIEETWRKESMSHSVAVVDGESHLPLRSTYRYAGVVMPVVDHWESVDGQFACFSGAHEAYERLERKVPCSRRKIFCRHGHYWLLIDRFTAASPEDVHTYQQRFQVGVPCRLDGERAVTEGAGGNLLVVPVAGNSGAPDMAPIPYPYKDHPEPTQLTFTRTVAGSTIMILLLVPFRDDRMPSVTVALLPVQADDREVPPWEITALEIVIDGERDVYVEQHMAWALPWQVAEFASHQRRFHSRCNLR